MTFIVAEDHYALRMGVRIMIERLYPHAVIKEAESFYDLEDLLHESGCDLLLLDIQIPGGGDARMIQRVRSIHPNIRILIFSCLEEDTYALSYVKAGANGYLQKTASPEIMQEAIQTVLQENTFVSKKVYARMLSSIPKQAERQQDGPNCLSIREHEVMQLMAKGADNREIKQTLNIKASTLSTYKAKIFSKMHVSNLIELVEKLNTTTPALQKPS